MSSQERKLIGSTVEDGFLVLTILETNLEGELVADRLRNELLSNFENHQASGGDKVDVVIDMHNIRYVSSVAFWPLLALRKKLREFDGRLVICGLSGAVGDVFYSTKMVDSSGASGAPFRMAEDRARALELLRQGPAPDETETNMNNQESADTKVGRPPCEGDEGPSQ